MNLLNPYIKNINRVEFTVNNSCTSRCKHCSEGHLEANKVIDEVKASKALQKISQYYKVGSIMTFGGEALIYPEKVCTIHQMAKTCGIPSRQLITNGCFSKNPSRITEVAKMLEESGVNCILLSVDGFHEEFLPLDWVRQFAEALLLHYKGTFLLHPSWVRDEKDDNPYNEKTRACLEYFSDLKISANEGNVIFPSGMAVKNLSEYFEKKPIDFDFRCGEAIYTTPLDQVQEIMIDCNGDVKPCCFPIGNINDQEIEEILRSYDPFANPYTKALIEKGIYGLVEVANKQQLVFNVEAHYSPCSLCGAIAKAAGQKK